ncbi:MAG: hypothetical protein M3389_07345, partial [Actinomycetota bacterium]|nr:hypothetical protein [Actinomycetota bacterium]
MNLVPRLIRTAMLLVAVLAVTAPPAAAAPTSVLIDRALQRGEIGDGQGALYRLQAVEDATRLPRHLRGDGTPEDGTLFILQAQQALRDGDIESPAMRERVREELTVQRRAAGETCWNSNRTLTHEHQTDHFRIEYVPSELGGVAIDQYGESLEHAWERHIDEFLWARPPIKPGSPARLHVRLDDTVLGANILGLVTNGGTHAGAVGDNPATPWDDVDANATCMVLRASYDSLGGEGQMRATSHHEFHHMVQYGMGSVFGPGAAEANFIEGGAKWIEDELVDEPNAVHGYFHSDLRYPMGEYQPWPYAYWAIFRAMTERYGTTVAGGAEDVMQRFWEKTSQGTAQLVAMEEAIAAEGTTLAAAFHDAAVMARLITPCSGDYLLAAPLCFEEGAGILARLASTGPRDPRIADGSLPIDQNLNSSVFDHYASRVIGLPEGSAPYRVSFGNSGGSSDYRATVACDTESTLRTFALGGALRPGEAGTAVVDPAGCPEVVAVVSNAHVTTGDPEPSGDPATVPSSPYRLATGTQARGILTVTRSAGGEVSGAGGGIDCADDCSEWLAPGTEVTLTATPASGKRFMGWGGACSGLATTCTIEVEDAAAVSATFADPRPTSTTLSCAPATVAPGGTTTCT